MPRQFYAGDLAGAKDLVRLDGKESHHLLRVMRGRLGNRVDLFDGRGCRGEGILEAVEKGQAMVRLQRWERHEPPALRLHLGVGVLKGERMVLAVQKAVELGAWRILPFVSRHSAVRPPTERRLQRLREVALEAAKQCGTAWLPEVAPVHELEGLLAREWQEILFFWEGAAGTGITVPERGDVLLVVGPEGGFSEAEVALARQRGARIHGLGPLVLRAETAVIAALAVCRYLALAG